MPARPALAPEQALAVTAWNLLGGLDWAGVPLVADLLGIDDVEMLVRQLMTIRDHFAERREGIHG